MKTYLKLRPLAAGAQKLFGSQWFWRVNLGLFTLQAVYLAFVGRFSMAFDEHFHLAAIKEYAHVIFPWSVTQPDGPAKLSAFTADGSYLYHYLMSWPYRLMTFMTDSQTAHIIMIRLLDIAIVVVGFYVFRKLLLELKLPRAAAHYILAFIMLMPMAPFMTGQLTYDSLFFTLGGLTMLALVRLTRSIAANGTLPLAQTAWATSLVLLTSQVKYAFLPAVLGAVLYMIGLLVWSMRKKNITVYALWLAWRKDIHLGGTMLAVGFVLLSGVLFMQRYGMNYARYGALVPECTDVLSHEQCLGFDPYARDTEIRSYGWYRDITTTNKLGYPFKWYNKMIRESYFSVGPKEAGYPVAKPLPVAYTTGIVLAFVLLAVVIVRLPWLLRGSPVTQLALAMVASYTLALFLKNFSAYLSTAIPLSIHGRYMLPFLPFIGYLSYEALRPLVVRFRWQHIATVCAVVLLLASFWGGGIAAYILGSNDAWYWPDAAPVSHAVRSVLAPFVIH